VTLGASYSMGRTLADAKSKKEAVAPAAVMIRDGRMPTLEEARREAAERRRTEREKRQRRPSEFSHHLALW
jgi:hypothetical protein